MFVEVGVFERRILFVIQTVDFLAQHLAMQGAVGFTPVFAMCTNRKRFSYDTIILIQKRMMVAIAMS